MWKQLYGDADRLSGLAVASNHDGRLEVFGLTDDGQVRHTWQLRPGGAWRGSWAELSGAADRFGQLRAAANVDGRLEVFGTTAAGGVRHTWQTRPNGVWSGTWAQLSAANERFATLEVRRNADGRLEVFAITEDGRVRHAWQLRPGGVWRDSWTELSGTAERLRHLRPAANPDGRLEVFALTADGRPRHTWQTSPNGVWRGSWADLSGTADRFVELDVGRNPDGRLEVFAVTEDGRLRHTWQVSPGGAWRDSWRDLFPPSQPFHGLRVAANLDGRLEVFARGADGRAWRTWQAAPGKAWHGRWVQMYGETDRPDGLAVGRNGDGRLEAFGTFPDGGVRQSWQVKAGRWPQAEEAEGRFDLQPEPLAMAGVHAALLRTGRVLFFSYDPEQEGNIGRGFWQLWDPATGPEPLRVQNRNLFCAGHCLLPDGRLLVSGGQSSSSGRGADHDVHTFDPVHGRWTRHADMPRARWYPTCVTLPNGDALMTGGHAVRSGPGAPVVNHDYETFQWRTDTKTPPARFDPGHVETYPFLCVLPDGTAAGTLFAFSNRETRLLTLGNMAWSRAFPTASPYRRTYERQGSCVLLPLLPEAPDAVRVMVVGGGGAGTFATNTAEIFEFDRANPGGSRWRPPAGGHMAFRRFMSDAVLLPDGTVLVVSGAEEGEADHSHQAVLVAELFDPRDERWRTLATINRPRLYHSCALLLPDGRVVVSGNTQHYNPDYPVEETALDVFSPPYLFQGPRPVLREAPEQLAYGQEYELAVDGDVASVALLRAGTTTHTNNMDQRHVGLAVRRDGTRLFVTSPGDGTVAPPGYYMVFAVSPAGVPSVAAWTRVGPP